MLRKIEKSAKNIKEALALAAEDLGVAPEELSYEVTREVGKGLMKLLVGSEVDIVAWVTKEAEAEEAKKEKKAAPKTEEKIKKAKKAEVEGESAETASQEKKSDKNEVRADFVIP